MSDGMKALEDGVVGAGGGKNPAGRHWHLAKIGYGTSSSSADASSSESIGPEVDRGVYYVMVHVEDILVDEVRGRDKREKNKMVFSWLHCTPLLGLRMRFISALSCQLFVTVQGPTSVYVCASFFVLWFCGRPLLVVEVCGAFRVCVCCVLAKGDRAGWVRTTCSLSYYCVCFFPPPPHPFCRPRRAYRETKRQCC